MRPSLEAQKKIKELREKYGKGVDVQEFTEVLEQHNEEALLILIEKKLEHQQELLLCQKAKKAILSIYVSSFKLNLEGQMALIDMNYRDILKLHFLRHGVDREAMAYYHDLKVFKEYLGVK